MLTGEAITIDSDHQVALHVAEAAGQTLVALRDAADPELDPQRLRDDGDRHSHQLIVRLLAELRPDDAVLSEEGADDAARLSHRRVWIVDPLDGTREYGEPGRTDWAVHIALVEEGTPTVAAVALPASSLVYSTSPAPTLPPAVSGRIRLVVSRSHTVRVNRKRILAAIELGLSNSKLEGLNSKIRLINHRGYGHHSAAALIAMIYLCCGGVTVELPLK